ncbi:hypothetical protein LTR99_001826 [Exophiala xenobiotica]|uniref:DUF6594 domain-containing protein n=1 Tax=Vermiconidia calcicola TaxID=1690605 RepID=A0AAV9Q8K8_9PEZI|nr:hypothetical protein H2202_009838 [Exophiala xenobiotica]KAK5536594.1 hypothetical protein LTR25_005268 [Vermiconidia calcicola]KAK5543265.1 hypothetical protein LTR23_004742 [Chaetothyriales sp. CCFEE 6169]KAK5189555.1 hypothetical protein LTR92_010457 [Exophiala xenobiotica]KAK5212070.1 hypothetical protein LTR41_002312 [Exophiala xenobiotica]
MVRYSEIASLMADCPESVVFRRFQALSARINIFLQADLCNLEQELDEIVIRASQPSSSDKSMCNAEDLDVEWEIIHKSQTSLAREYRDKIAEAQRTLGTYYENISKWAEVRKFGSPSSTNHRWMKDWLLLKRPVEGPMNVKDMCPWMESPLAELLTLSPKLDSLDRWLAERWVPLWHNMVGERSKTLCNGEQTPDVEAQPTVVFRYTPKSLILVGDACTVLLSSAILVSSVVALNFTKATYLRLILISVFTTIFSSTLMFAARCRRFEVFAGTAAFCAVLIVFLQGVSSVMDH